MLQNIQRKNVFLIELIYFQTKAIDKNVSHFNDLILCFFSHSFRIADVDATLTMKKRNSSDDEPNEHKRLGDIHVEFNIGSASVHLDNLFNGDPELGAMMNKFLNQNWREITAEVRPALGESIERILYGIATQLHEMYGLDKLLE